MKSKNRFRSSIVLAAVLLSSLAALAAADAKPVVNVNTADASQLSMLPRIGMAVAQRVIDYRKQNGPFKTTDELMLVRGIGEKVYAQLKPYVATAGETTLTEKVGGAGKSGGGKSGGGRGKSSGKSKRPAAPARPKAGAQRAEGRPR